MSYTSIVISSGHGLYVRGAAGILDEVDEARLVVEALADELKERGVDVVTYHDDVSKSQNENLNRIVDFHNAQPPHDLDISVHFNAYEQVDKPMGTEVLYLTQSALASDLSAAISEAGHLINRGGKKRTDLFVLNNCAAPTVLLEVCFVDSEADADLYRENFAAIVEAIGDVLTDELDVETVEPIVEASFHAIGKCSYFGGPDDTGVSASEGLAFYDDFMQQPELFLPYQPDGTTGLARRLNPQVHYLACRWDYAVTSREVLRKDKALVTATGTGRSLTAFPGDWGPNENTGRVADLSPGLLFDLGIDTDDEVEIIFPYEEETS